MTADDNEIVVYQPDEAVRLDVRLENETVWLAHIGQWRNGGNTVKVRGCRAQRTRKEDYESRREISARHR